MGVKVKELIEKEQAKRLSLRLLAGREGLVREITSPRIQKPGLLLTGLLDELHPDRIQIFGAAEIGYLKSLSVEKLSRSLSILERSNVPAIIVTKGLDVPSFLTNLATERGIPLFLTTLTSSILIERLTGFLEERLAPVTTMHGVLVDVLGIGILIIGKSGIGKSECALELVSRGYRLVSDDVVVVKKIPPSTLYGMSTELIRYHIEVRGLGIVNIKDLFGITAIREKKQMDLVVELIKWDPDTEYERLGFEDSTYEILGVELPYLRIPVSPGRSVATTVEVAARNQILKIMGHYSSRIFQQQLNDSLRGFKKVKV